MTDAIDRLMRAAALADELTAHVRLLMKHATPTGCEIALDFGLSGCAWHKKAVEILARIDETGKA